MNPKIFVLAGNFREFRDYVSSLGNGEYHKYQYIASVEQLAGQHGITVIYYGNYKDNPVYKNHPYALRNAMIPAEETTVKIKRGCKEIMKTIIVYLSIIVAFVVIYLFGMCVIAAKDLFVGYYGL